MKKELSLIFALFALIFASCSKKSEIVNDQNSSPVNVVMQKCSDTTSPFVFIELYSSESCYDCPEAEVLLNEWVGKERASGRNIISIATHVDYWNDLIDGQDDCKGNWNDPFSNAAFTSRQFAYAHHMGSTPVTPQFVINGKENIDGTEKDSLNNKIERTYKELPGFGLCLEYNSTLSDISKRKLVIDFETQKRKNISNEFRKKMVAQVMLFVVERSVSSKPNKGENCGKVLHHENIVRAYAAKTLYSSKSGNIEITLPENILIENCSVVGCIQNLLDLNIVGASSGFDLSPLVKK